MASIFRSIQACGYLKWTWKCSSETFQGSDPQQRCSKQTAMTCSCECPLPQSGKDDHILNSEFPLAKRTIEYRRPISWPHLLFWRCYNNRSIVPWQPTWLRRIINSAQRLFFVQIRDEKKKTYIFTTIYSKSYLKMNEGLTGFERHEGE